MTSARYVLVESRRKVKKQRAAKQIALSRSVSVREETVCVPGGDGYELEGRFVFFCGESYIGLKIECGKSTKKRLTI